LGGEGEVQDVEWKTGLSVVAIVLSAISLGWNIYRDVVLKPRIKVSAKVCALMQMGVNTKPPIKLMVTAVNFGPGDVYCQGVIARRSNIWRRFTRRVDNWFIVQESPDLPQKLGVGQSLNVLLPYEKAGIIEHPFTHIGISDSFSRVHWVSRSDQKRLRAQIRKDFSA
jgi:hypothetical protein